MVAKTDNQARQLAGHDLDPAQRAAWAYGKVGGYQVLDKWLKDRRGRMLTFDDLAHYQKVVVALQETIRLKAEIDAAIPEWPLA